MASSGSQPGWSTSMAPTFASAANVGCSTSMPVHWWRSSQIRRSGSSCTSDMHDELAQLYQGHSCLCFGSPDTTDPWGGSDKAGKGRTVNSDHNRDEITDPAPRIRASTLLRVRNVWLAPIILAAVLML